MELCGTEEQDAVYQRKFTENNIGKKDQFSVGFGFSMRFVDNLHLINNSI